MVALTKPQPPTTNASSPSVFTRPLLPAPAHVRPSALLLFPTPSVTGMQSGTGNPHPCLRDCLPWKILVTSVSLNISHVPRKSVTSTAVAMPHGTDLGSPMETLLKKLAQVLACCSCVGPLFLPPSWLPPLSQPLNTAPDPKPRAVHWRQGGKPLSHLPRQLVLTKQEPRKLWILCRTEDSPVFCPPGTQR